MCAIQNTNLALLIWCYIIDNNYRKAGLFKRKLTLNAGRPFNNPESEDFTCVDEIICITQLFTYFSRFISWISRNDSVNKCRTENVFIINPDAEIAFKTPEIYILMNTFKQLITVVIYELTGKDNESR